MEIKFSLRLNRINRFITSNLLRITIKGVLKMENTKALINNVIWLNNNTPDGMVVDADTILADLVENADMHFTGLAQDIFNIWEQSSDKKAVERMFYEFTEVEFTDFLEKCINEITAR